MKFRNLILLLWAIDRGGLPRIFALAGIIAFLIMVVLLFLSLVGGPTELIRHLCKP